MSINLDGMSIASALTRDVFPFATSESLLPPFSYRVCPGKAFVDSLLFLSFACVLAAFEIRPFVDPASGAEEVPKLVYDNGLIR